MLTSSMHRAQAAVAMVLAYMSTVDALAVCEFQTCATFYDSSQFVEQKFDCGGAASLLKNFEITLQDDEGLSCDNSSLALDPSSKSGYNATGCDMDILKTMIENECLEQIRCKINWAKIGLAAGCTDPSVLKSVTVEAQCVKKPDILTYLVLAVTCLIAFGLGNSVDTPVWIVTGKREWKGILIGLFCQYGFMPAYAFAISKIFLTDRPILVSVGLILAGSVPGGSMSNLITKIGKGNVALSIIMSAASGFAAFGFLPLLILIYVNAGLGVSLDSIPWKDVAVSLAVIIAAPILGFLFRKYVGEKPFFNKTWKGKPIVLHEIATSVSLVLGFIFILVVIAIGIRDSPEYFTKITETADAWLIAVFFQPVAFAAGYLLAWIFRFERPECRAISIETGMQNTTVAIAICSLAYSGCDRYYSLYLVMIISLWMMINGLLLGFIFKYIAKFDPPRKVHPTDGTVTNSFDVETSGEKSPDKM